jgi:hypothetical protein
VLSIIVFRKTLHQIRESPAEELQLIAAALNVEEDGSEALNLMGFGSLSGDEKVPNLLAVKRILRDYVTAWRNSGPDAGKFKTKNPDMWLEIERQWSTEPPRLWPTDGGMVSTVWFPSRIGIARNVALRFFITLLTNPLCESVRGPCPRCDRYFVGRKVYCSRSCGTKSTALAATKKARDREHQDKLIRAAQASREYCTARTKTSKMNWKEWVSRRHPDITAKFLTRAVNKGELETPIRVSGKEK